MGAKDNRKRENKEGEIREMDKEKVYLNISDQRSKNTLDQEKIFKKRKDNELVKIKSRQIYSKNVC